ncbi:hypothetical protein JCM17092_02580 [Haloplanus litoreus]
MGRWYGADSYSAHSAALDATERVDTTVVATSLERVKQRRGTDGYRPRATFNHTYEGEADTSSNVYPGGVTHEFETKEDARAKLEGYEPGATVTAYVPTDSPGNAFLKHRSSNKPFYIIGLGALLALGTSVSIFRN